MKKKYQIMNPGQEDEGTVLYHLLIAETYRDEKLVWTYRKVEVRAFGHAAVEAYENAIRVLNDEDPSIMGFVLMEARMLKHV